MVRRTVALYHGMISETLTTIRQYVALWGMKRVVNSAAVIAAALTPQRTTTGIPVFLFVQRKQWYLGIVAMLSLWRYVPDVSFTLIPDFPETMVFRLVCKLLPFPVTVVSARELLRIETRLSAFPWAKRYYAAGWYGKKFFVPLLFGTHGKAIVLDTDTIFLKYPADLVRWLRQGNGQRFLTDCDPYAVLSRIEAASILNKPPHLKNVNSGLLCLDRSAFWKHVSLRDIDQFVKKIGAFLSERRTFIVPASEPLKLASPHIEQTMYWLAFERTAARPFPPSYYVWGKHMLYGKPVGSPVMLHFAGEDTKRSHYRYLFFSLMTSIHDKIHGRPDPFVFSSSKNYCVRCIHTKGKRQ